MSTRSDVAIAVKAEFVSELEEKFSHVVGDVDERMERDEGVCYLIRDIHWDCLLDEEILFLYAWLKSKGLGNFKVVEVCHDYPDNCDGDAGEWNDNPWKICKEVTTRLGGIFC